MSRALAIVLFAALALASGGSAHVRYGCTQYGQPALCPFFRGETNDPGDHHRIDPINVVFSPYGSWTDPYVHNLLDRKLGWHHECGSGQVNYRALGSMSGGVYWDWARENGQQASNGCPHPGHQCFYSASCDRFHVRVFVVHQHPTHYENSSAGDAHHESNTHAIDADWEYAEDTLRIRAYNVGHGVTSAWTYLPRADCMCQGWWSDGWASRITGWS